MHELREDREEKRMGRKGVCVGRGTRGEHDDQFYTTALHSSMDLQHTVPV